jgi:hypothetical protein
VQKFTSTREGVEFVGVGKQNKKNRLFPKGDKKGRHVWKACRGKKKIVFSPLAYSLTPKVKKFGQKINCPPM